MHSEITPKNRIMKYYLNKLFYTLVLILGILGIYLLLSYKLFINPIFIIAIFVPFLTLIFYKYFNPINKIIKIFKALLICLGLFYSVMIISNRFLYFMEIQSNRNEFHSQSSVNFEKNNYHLSVRKAKKENKFIFLDIYTGWCGPCLQFSKTVLKDENVSQLLNSKFINLKYDAEVGDGIEINKKYNKSAYPSYIYPTILILDSNGNIREDIGKNGVPDTKTMRNILEKYK